MTDLETGAVAWPRRRLGEHSADGSRAPTSQVVVIDDHALLAESVVVILRQSGLDARTLAFGAPNMIETVRNLRPDLVLLDLFLDGSPELSHVALAAFTEAGVGVLVVTASTDHLLHARCLELGALGVVEKSQPIDELIDAVLRAVRREPIMSMARVQELQRSLAESRRVLPVVSLFDTLTAREKSILHSITDGYAAARIARDQQISVLTVRAHLRSILAKLGVHSQLEAVSLASREGWFRP